MMKIEKTVPVESVFKYLPQRLRLCLTVFCDKYPERAENITEVRLRVNGAFSVSISEENILPELSCGTVICTPQELSECVFLLCRRSYQSHEAEIEQGYISVPGGIRAGVAFNKAFDGKVHTVNSVCIRIPGNVTADVSELFADGVSSCLIYSPPGVGKTTVLRLCVKKLCEMGLRVSVIDTRFELFSDAVPSMADYICGCERGFGIECAVRSLSPQVIVCDEIGGERESASILQAANSGVPFIATAHAGSLEELFRRTGISMLKNAHVFSKYIGLRRKNKKFFYDISE